MPSTSERCIWQRNLTAAVVLLLGMFLIGCNGAGSAASTSSSQSANDPPPSLAISSSSPLPQGQVAVQFQFQFAASGGTSPYTWQLASGSLAPGLSMESGSGSVSGTPQKSGSYSFTVKVQDSAGHTAQAQFSQAIAPPALAVSTSSLAQGTVGSAYSASLAATGGTAPYGWQITAGQLPPGLGLTSDGKISGTPTASGQYNFTAQVSDSSSPVQTASAKLSITIAVMALTIGTAALPSGTLNSAYNAALNASGGTTPYTWSVTSGSLPAGLSLSSSGQISGTPTAIGTSAFTVQVVDSSSPVQTATANESIQIDPVKLDAYGGRTDITCSTGATGYWSLEEISSRWWFCDPLGNAFFMQGVQAITNRTHPDSGGMTAAQVDTQRFGNATTAWGPVEAERLLSWGFNTIGPYSLSYIVPTTINSNWPTDSNGLHSMPVKLPFVYLFRPGYYAERNPIIYTTAGQKVTFLSQSVKSMIYGMSPFYHGYLPPDLPDIFDSGIYSWLKDDIEQDSAWATTANSRYFNYLVGVTTDDNGDLFGIGAGDAFPTVPAGHNNWNLGWITAIVSPVQTANSSLQQLYPVTTVYTKQAWENYLSAKYGSISALNAAWGSNYTTFASSGTQITSEAVGTANGSTANFSHTLAHLTPSAYSVAIYVGGKLVGGDDGRGNIWGDGLSGSINYSTGALSLVFSTAPAMSTAITVNYMQNGWCIGTGVMDECDQPAHQTWMGNDPIYLSNANANVKADVSGFLYDLANEYFGQCEAVLKKAYPQLLYLGSDTFGSWGVPPRAPILQAAAKDTDAIVMNGALTQAMIDYVAKYYGNRPYLTTSYMVAQADSELSGYTSNCPATQPGCYDTQADRGQAYLNMIESIWNATATVDGVHPYVGNIWWGFYDDWGEHMDWGLVSNRENAYDGHEAVTGTVPCSPPLGQYTCGSDLGDYGDVIDSVRQANSYWLSH